MLPHPKASAGGAFLFPGYPKQVSFLSQDFILGATRKATFFRESSTSFRGLRHLCMRRRLMDHGVNLGWGTKRIQTLQVFGVEDYRMWRFIYNLRPGLCYVRWTLNGL